MLTGSDIFARLTGDPAVVAVVSTRVYPQYIRAADLAYPYAVYKRQNVAMGTSYGGPTGLNTCDLVLAVVGKTQATAEAAANAILGVLDDDAGQWGQTNVQGCFLADDGLSDDTVNEPESEAIVAYVKELTFNVIFNS